MTLILGETSKLLVELLKYTEFRILESIFCKSFIDYSVVPRVEKH